ncbi:MAG TPA: hypothetical protein VG838_07655 [Opitutaceae bacterium]|nr:hypothetical protein [Opitutaceae bacterium]
MPAKLIPFLALLGAMLAGGLGGCSMPASAGRQGTRSAPVSSRHEQLRQALAKADRLTIVAAPAAGGSPVTRDLSGASVADFLDCVEIDEAYGPVRCESPRDALFTFYAGQRPIATISLHRLGYLHWEGGLWGGSDAVITTDSSQRLQQWAKQAGADVTVMLQGVAAQETQRAEEARQRFFACFTPEARKIFAQADTVVYNSRHLRRVSTPLASLYSDPAAFAEAGLRALGESPQRWLEDDWATGAVETALLGLDPALVTAAMDRVQAQQTSSLGAARLFFHAGFEAKLPAADRGARAVRLADLVLRAGRDSDKHAMLECLALVPGDAPADFLRAVARGDKTYAYAPPYTELTSDTEEPGLRSAAALLLAKRADPGAAAIIASLAALKPFGPDQAALEIAAALGDGAAPLKPAHFKYHSRLLGVAALAALEWRPGSGIPVDVLSAACTHFQEDVAGRAEKLAEHYQLQRADEGTGTDELAIDYDPLLASSDPQAAIQEYSALIPKVAGLTLARLYSLRGQAYANLGNYASAEADYLNVEKSPFADGTDVRTRLAWVQWYLGEFDAAEQTIEDALKADPSAELVLLRGIMHYGLGDFSRGTEADLIAARVLDPTEGYAPLFQHFAATLGGRPEQSQLRAYLASSPDLPDWPRQIMGFVLGYIDARRLLEIAAASDPNEVDWHTCEATFYISQAARVAGHTEEERKYLEQCAGTNQPNVAEFWVAKYRLDKLRPARNAFPSRTRPGNAPSI